MEEELFDLIDENNKPLGITKKRSEVHRDGDWHRAVHILIYNEQGDVLLQRRSLNKDSDANMLDLSCCGHLCAGDDSITGALRELKEELGLEVEASELEYVATLKRSPQHDDGFIDNEYDDIYILETSKRIEEFEMQEEEISEILFVPYKDFKIMCQEGREDLVDLPDEYPIFFDKLDERFDS